MAYFSSVADNKSTCMSTDIRESGSPIPLILFLLSALVTPFIVLQASAAVSTVALGINPRGLAGRTGPPWGEIATLTLAIVIGGAFLLVLTRRARSFGMGWALSGFAVVIVLIGICVAFLVGSVSGSYLAEIASTPAQRAARAAYDLTFFGGADIAIAVMLLAPFAASPRPSRLKAVQPVYIAAVGMFALYGVVPQIMMLAAFG